MIKATCICMPNCILAEGCIWNREENRLYFTDIDGRQVFSLKGSVLTAFPQEDRTGTIVFSKSGGFVAAVTNRLVLEHRSDGANRILLRQNFPEGLRYNDGKCDMYGNLWVGTMYMNQSRPEAKGGGSLYCISSGQVLAEYSGFTIPNGMDWSRDGSIFYHVDTALQCIAAYDVRDQIHLLNRRVAVSVAEEDGSPDGMCADENGNLWTALWGGGKVICYEPFTGKKLEEIAVPDKYVSCCCFGGTDNRTLYITTARDEHGCGGQIYRASLGIKGGKTYQYEDKSEGGI
ncbi:MAG: SMP-30/gluconolactonase/LRE family protein [Lachnospiraceae bacterium]|nr:SMP-30/gluconolactonase/LRE family protein [Lachnospiraceae bacterium]